MKIRKENQPIEEKERKKKKKMKRKLRQRTNPCLIQKIG